jgi:hypothetical protein
MSLHLVEHVREGALQLQCLLDFTGRDVRIFAVLQETRALVVAEELDEGRNIRLQSEGNPSSFSKIVLIPVRVNSATASSVYLSKSVSKIPWYMKYLSWPMSNRTHRR